MSRMARAATTSETSTGGLAAIVAAKFRGKKQPGSIPRLVTQEENADGNE